ncbi:hypothetical protein H9P43_007531 [Blastocladiella emersonii ATCC 22665]|nr:hypothetical protein H9P43_007531 [Blastocladiella emersonii ATCC 22665]
MWATAAASAQRFEWNSTSLLASLGLPASTTTGLPPLFLDENPISGAPRFLVAFLNTNRTTDGIPRLEIACLRAASIDWRESVPLESAPAPPGVTPLEWGLVGADNDTLVLVQAVVETAPGFATPVHRFAMTAIAGLRAPTGRVTSRLHGEPLSAPIHTPWLLGPDATALYALAQGFLESGAPCLIRTVFSPTPGAPPVQTCMLLTLPNRKAAAAVYARDGVVRVLVNAQGPALYDAPENGLPFIPAMPNLDPPPGEIRAITDPRADWAAADAAGDRAFVVAERGIYTVAGGKLLSHTAVPGAAPLGMVGPDLAFCGDGRVTVGTARIASLACSPDDRIARDDADRLLLVSPAAGSVRILPKPWDSATPRELRLAPNVRLAARGKYLVSGHRIVALPVTQDQLDALPAAVPAPAATAVPPRDVPDDTARSGLSSTFWVIALVTTAAVLLVLACGVRRGWCCAPTAYRKAGRRGSTAGPVLLSPVAHGSKASSASLDAHRPAVLEERAGSARRPSIPTSGTNSNGSGGSGAGSVRSLLALASQSSVSIIAESARKLSETFLPPAAGASSSSADAAEAGESQSMRRAHLPSRPSRVHLLAAELCSKPNPVSPTSANAPKPEQVHTLESFPQYRGPGDTPATERSAPEFPTAARRPTDGTLYHGDDDDESGKAVAAEGTAGSSTAVPASTAPASSGSGGGGANNGGSSSDVTTSSHTNASRPTLAATAASSSATLHHPLHYALSSPTAPLPTHRIPATPGASWATWGEPNYATLSYGTTSPADTPAPSYPNTPDRRSRSSSMGTLYHPGGAASQGPSPPRSRRKRTISGSGLPMLLPLTPPVPTAAAGVARARSRSRSGSRTRSRARSMSRDLTEAAAAGGIPDDPLAEQLRIDVAMANAAYWALQAEAGERRSAVGPAAAAAADEVGVPLVVPSLAGVAGRERRRAA